MNIDVELLFKDSKYKEFMKEYHKFVLYILNAINKHTIHSCRVIFNDNNILYEKRIEFISILKETFPTFDITFESNDENKEEYIIIVDWNNHIKK
jgi:hypothetical protein